MNLARFSLLHIFLFIVLFGGLLASVFLVSENQNPDSKAQETASIGNVAKLDDYWRGNAEWELVNKISKTSGKWKFDPDFVTGVHIEVVGNTWYLFSRRSYYDHNENCRWHSLASGRQVSAGTVVRRSTDKGQTWSDPVDIIIPERGRTWECLGTDGDAFYDAQANAWHYLFQCVGSDAVWHGCHLIRMGSDPMGPWQEVHQNPVIRSGQLWRGICNDQQDNCHQIAGGNNVKDEGTYDIFGNFNGAYWIAFHGAYEQYGFRGIARTGNFKDFSTGDLSLGLPTDSIIDKFDATNWRENWIEQPIGGGAGSIVQENGYYYLLVEIADKNLACVAGAGQHWNWGLFRSKTLTSNSWDQYPQQNPILYSEIGSNACEGMPGYARLFKDSNGETYMHYSLEVQDDETNGFYLYKLVKKNNFLKNGNLWKCTPENWNRISPSTQTTNLTVYRQYKNSSEGACFLATNCAGGSCQQGQSIYQDFNVPGIGERTIIYGGEFAAESGQGEIEIVLHEFGDQGKLLDHKNPLTFGQNYQKFERQITINPQTRKVRFEFYLKNPTTVFADSMYVRFANSSFVPQADFNQDNNVDIFDYAKLIETFGNKMPETGSITDLNADTFVDVFDYSLFVEDFHKFKN